MQRNIILDAEKLNYYKFNECESKTNIEFKSSANTLPNTNLLIGLNQGGSVEKRVFIALLLNSKP